MGCLLAVVAIVGNLGVYPMDFLHSEECCGYGCSLEGDFGYFYGAMECAVGAMIMMFMFMLVFMFV